MRHVQLQYKIKKEATMLIVIFFLLLAPFGQVNAARFFFVSSAETLGVNEEIEVILKIDTEGEIVNAVGGRILFPDTILEGIDITTGDSIIPIWVQRPELTDEGALSFSGIVPGGFAGFIDPLTPSVYLPGELLRFTVRGKSEGSAALRIEGAQALLNDGVGTPAVVASVPVTVRVHGDGEKRVAVEDTLPPEPFVVSIETDPAIFDGNYFLVFNAQDKQSGVRYYEVQEGDRQWRQAESPYELRDQLLTGRVLVKAVDGAGNARIVEVVSGESLRTPLHITLAAVILLLIFSVIIWFRRSR